MQQKQKTLTWKDLYLNNILHFSITLSRLPISGVRIGNFAILIQSETFSSTPYPIHIRNNEIMDSDIQSKSEAARSIAH